MNQNRIAGWALRALFACCFGLLAASPAYVPPAPADFILDFVSDVKGNLEPCG